VPYGTAKLIQVIESAFQSNLGHALAARNSEIDDFVPAALS
jgi:hypothetical protein